MTDALTLRPLGENGQAAWDAFVAACPEATFFHRAGWRRVVEDSFGHRTFFHAAERGGHVVGILPLTELKSLLFGHALVSNGYCVSGGPAVTEEEARAALNARAEDIFRERGADYLEVRCPIKPQDGWLTRNDLYAGFSGPLPADEAENLKMIPRKQRAVVRKAIDSTLTWRIDDTVDDFFRLYAISVRNLGTPVFAKKYFANLLREFAPDCDVLTVASNGKPVASVLSFYFRDSVLPFYTGSDPVARQLGANDMMYWRLMRHAAARGATRFDFGRSKVGTGPYNFKKNWGFEPVPLMHQFLTKPGTDMPNVNPTNPKYRLMIAAWKQLPLWVSTILGPVIARNIG